MAYMDTIRLPAEIEAFGNKGTLLAVRPRTPRTRVYIIQWATGEQAGEIHRYQGGASRPDWLRHLRQPEKETAHD